MCDLASTIAKLFCRDTHLIEQRQEEVCHWRFVIVNDVPSRFQLAVATTQNNHWQVFVTMAVSVAETAAVDNHAMIEKRAIAFLNRLQLLNEVGELLQMVAVDFRDLLDQVRDVAMMRNRVMSVGEAKRRVGAIATFAAV